MEQLGLYLIVKDEEETLERCISSFKGIYDELVIVDTGSIDATISIAKKFTDKVYTLPWRDDFAYARTFAMKKVKSPWQMWADADDIFVPNDINKLKEFITSCEKETIIPIIHFPYHISTTLQNGEEVPVYTVERERIHRKGSGFWKGAVHECFISSAPVVIYKDAWYVHKKPEFRTRSDTLFQNILTATLSKDEVEDKSRNLCCLAHDLQHKEKYNEAIEKFCEAIEIIDNDWEAIGTWYDLSTCYLAAEFYELARDASFEVIKRDTHFTDAYVVLGQVAQHYEDWEMVIAWMKTAITITKSSMNWLTPVFNRTYYPLECIAYAYWSLGDRENAIRYYKDALVFKPGDSTILEYLEMLRS